MLRSPARARTSGGWLTRALVKSDLLLIKHKDFRHWQRSVPKAKWTKCVSPGILGGPHCGKGNIIVLVTKNHFRHRKGFITMSFWSITPEENTGSGSRKGWLRCKHPSRDHAGSSAYVDISEHLQKIIRFHCQHIQSKIPINSNSKVSFHNVGMQQN